MPKGKFRITDGNGNSAVVDLTQDSDDTIGKVIREINTRGLAISARINNTGDGILIEKTSGTQALQVTEVDNGSTARALGLLATPNGSETLTERWKRRYRSRRERLFRDLSPSCKRRGRRFKGRSSMTVPRWIRSA